MAESKFPQVQGGGSLMLAWQVKNRRVLVVGGGEVAAGRIVNLLNADAIVTVVSPRDGLNEEVAYRVQQNQVQYVDRVFLPIDLEDPSIAMVLVAIDDPEASTRIYKYCQKIRVPANIADVPPECDFYFGSVHRDGPLQIMISTNGRGPRLAAMVRREVASKLPPNLGAAIDKVGKLRGMLRVQAPEPNQSKKRMGWMSRVCDEWSLEDLGAMDEVDMTLLLKYFAPNEVPSADAISKAKEQAFSSISDPLPERLKPHESSVSAC